MSLATLSIRGIHLSSCEVCYNVRRLLTCFKLPVCGGAGAALGGLLIVVRPLNRHLKRGVLRDLRLRLQGMDTDLVLVRLGSYGVAPS